jgi:hypothetical protein
MGFTATNKGGEDFPPIETGVHHAICYGVIDIGTQHNIKWNQFQHKGIIIWELPLLRFETKSGEDTLDKPKVISRTFTVSLGEKSHLRPFLESWRGKPFSTEELLGFDLSKLIGVKCQLNIIHNTEDAKTYANVATAMPLSANMEKLHPENETIYYSIEDHGMRFPASTPEWIQKKIMMSQEYTEFGSEGYVPQSGDEEPPIPDESNIPF